MVAMDPVRPIHASRGPRRRHRQRAGVSTRGRPGGRRQGRGT